jgi:hypothetical protein
MSLKGSKNLVKKFLAKDRQIFGIRATCKKDMQHLNNGSVKATDLQSNSRHQFQQSH